MFKEALIHKADSSMCYLTDDGNVVITLKAKKGDLSQAVLIYDDRYDFHIKRDCIRIPLQKVMSDELYDYFQAEFKCAYRRMCYYFSLIDKDGNHVYMYQDGFSDVFSWGRQRLFQFPYLHRRDTPHVPAWLKESVMYQIFPDSFANGKGRIPEQPASHTVEGDVKAESRFGGTLRGIIDNISYIKDLGVNLIYLNPVFTALSYHKYDTVDYYKVDPCLGTNDNLKELVEICHSNGIRVMLDIVFNQSSNKFFAFRDVVENGANSGYAGWYHIESFPVKGGKAPNYETFGFYETMPKFNTDNLEVEEYLLDVARYWVREYDVDGYRLDVANELPHEFWRRLRHEMDKLKKDFVLIGEVWHDASSWIGRDQFHSVMNFPLMYAIWEFFGLNSVNAHQFSEAVNRLTMLYPKDNTQAMMNFIDNHDVARFFTIAGANVDKLKMAAAFIMTYVGLPSVYYGDEKGVEGRDINDARRKMIWEDDERSASIHSCFKKLIRLRRENEELIYGDYRPLHADNAGNVYSFARVLDQNSIICVFNNATNATSVSLPAGNGTYEDLLTQEGFKARDGLLSLPMDAYGVRILKLIKG